MLYTLTTTFWNLYAIGYRYAPRVVIGYNLVKMKNEPSLFPCFLDG